MRKNISIALVLLATSLFAQNGKVLEEIVAVIGDNVILKSDLETEYLQAQESMDIYAGDLKCEVLNQLIIQKLYLHKGEMDSVIIEPERIESEIDRRVKYYASQIGGERQLERYLGKTIEEYKALMRSKVKEQMIIQEVQQSLISDVTVSPTQVRTYFQSLHKDSIPTFSDEVEVAQIVMAPEPTDFAKEYALDKMKEIRAAIIAGKYTFDYAARFKSDDKGTAVNGGELGYFTRGQMVGPFERVAFKLPKDSISEIIETQFGYHIMQLIDRKGEKVNARHILIKPLIVNSDFIKLKAEMDNMLLKLKADSISLCKVASENSSDPYTKDNCGYFTDPNTGAQIVQMSLLDPQIISIVKGLKPGEYTDPMMFQNYDGTEAYRIIYLKSMRPEHKANLRDDYQKIQKLALAQAQDDAVKAWVKSYKSGVFVKIDDKYKNCDELAAWRGLN